ncbi:DUF445 family protein [Salipaludibacillus sp. CUR1]|uniref:DUF445 domain-containing protein n=1 Tax=Salipaludibacillus sp. CUR1 TaxID=2820003 RepID=UPI001E43DA12|nr:DUF445 family protein [Salipaludibacillus sp. CUR1]MCE7793705.1 DUF445 family protein [Salipaludibacillus sp. CUR1]
MGNAIILLTMLVLIGAIIGGGTNVIAIRMLFRPYKPVYLGSFRLPFTPGLIPKRRQEIADSLGKTVEEHLVTPEGIQARLKDGVLLREIEDRLSNGIKELLQDERTLDEWIEINLEKKEQMKTVRMSIEKGMKAKLTAWIYEYKDRPVKEWAPLAWQKKLESKIPDVAENILKKTETYLLSEEGRRQIDAMIDRFFESKGSFTSMFGRMASRFSLSSAITKELLRFLRQPHTKQLLTHLLHNEWKAAVSKAPSEFITDEMIEEKVHTFTEQVVGQAPVIGEWSKPLSAWSGKYESVIRETLLPSFMASASTILSRYIKSMIKKIGIRDIVKDEVNQFPLSRLEHMLLLIANRELKMIAVLGGIIGALVGFVQGIIVLFFI